MTLTNLSSTDTEVSRFFRELSDTLSVAGPEKTLHALQSTRYEHIGLNEELYFILTKIALYLDLNCEDIMRNSNSSKLKNAFALFIYHAHFDLKYSFGDLHIKLQKSKGTLHNCYKRIIPILKRNNSISEANKKVFTDIQKYTIEKSKK